MRRNLAIYLCDPRKADGFGDTCRYTTNPKHAVINDMGQLVRALPGEFERGDRVYHDPLALVDESKLSKEDRLGLAYCRLNSWKWDELFGPKPVGFEDLPDYNRPGETKITKGDYISPIMRSIELNCSDMTLSRCWWIFELEKTEEEWIAWYFGERLERTDQSDQRNDRWDRKREKGPGISILRRFLSFFKPG